MKPFLMLAISCWAVLSCHAAEIVAWKVPLSRFVGSGLQSEGIVRLDSAPEASPFFKEGDELWDLKGIPAEARKETEPPSEWAVWNATSGRLVVKGEWYAIWQLEGRLQLDQLPKQCRLTAEVLVVPADGSSLKAETKPALVLSWVTHGSNEFNVAWQQDGQMMRAKGKVLIEEDKPLVDITLEFTCVVKDQPQMNYKSELVIQSGNPIWLARDFDGLQGLDFRLTPRIELLDGTPESDIMMIQKGAKAEPFKVNPYEFKRHRIGGNGWLAIQSVDPQILEEFKVTLDSAEDSQSDPFAKGEVSDDSGNSGVSGVRVPDEIKSWFDGPVWNVGSVLKGMAVVDGTSESFAGYDPMSQRVFLYSNDETELQRFEMILQPGCVLPARMVVATLEGDGQHRLVGRSGVISRLERSIGEGKPVRSLEIEPTVGGGFEVLDTRVTYFDKLNFGRHISLSNAYLMPTGKPVELMEASSKDGDSTSIRLNAIIQSVYDMGEGTW